MARIDFLSNNTAIALDVSIAKRAEPRRQGYRIKASEIADPCERKLWASFRWISPVEVIDPKKQRIFDMGNYIEACMVRDFKAMPGVEVKDVEYDEDGQPTDKQIGVSFADGHGFGYLDGRMLGVVEAPKTPHVLEVKSMKNTDFNATVKHGVMKEKPLHYAQCQIYMHKTGDTRTLYAFECKNTSERHFERIEYDFTFATQLEAKAERIAFAERAPVRAFDDPDAFPCSFCNHRSWCWKLTVDLPARSCRTCAHVTPLSGGRWMCERKGSGKSDLTREDQEAGCKMHLYNPDMVNGTISGGDGSSIVIYDLPNGDQFIDTVEAE